jgi:cytochrome c oxidase assembly protein subunit 15
MLPITSRWWRESEPLPPTAGANKLQQAAVFVVLLSYGQIVLGALVRHAPHLTSPLAPTLFQLAVYFHLLVAGGLLVQVLSLGWQSSKLRQRRGGAAALALLVLIQIALGATSWVVKYGIPSWLANLWGDLSFVNTAEGSLPTVIVTSHVAVGSLILATALVIALRQARQLRVGPPRLFLTTLSNREVVL